jgi:polyribonucleotide nucleotidyltransferase
LSARSAKTFSAQEKVMEKAAADAASYQPTWTTSPVGTHTVQTTASSNSSHTQTKPSSQQQSSHLKTSSPILQSKDSSSSTNAPQTNPTTTSWSFNINQIILGQSYEWYIKLSYNYGLFVTVMGVEWLLHKNFITAPDGVSRKKYYNIGDKISVKAMEFKEINGEKRVVWSMG